VTNSGTINITNSSLPGGSLYGGRSWDGEPERGQCLSDRHAGPGARPVEPDSRDWFLDPPGGTLKDGVVNMSGGAVLNVAANDNNRFSNVIINGDVNLPNDNSLLRWRGW